MSGSDIGTPELSKSSRKYAQVSWTDVGSVGERWRTALHSHVYQSPVLFANRPARDKLASERVPSLREAKAQDVSSGYMVHLEILRMGSIDRQKNRDPPHASG